MNFKEFFRDKTRDKLQKALRDIGVNCSLSDRGIVEEQLFNPWHRTSLGIIKINSDYLIEYINIIKKWGSKNDPPRWWIYFAIPFQTSESKKDYIEVKSIRKKTLPIFGKVVSVDWQYNDKGKILGNKFINSPEINSLSMQLGNIKVQSLHESFSGYSIELEFKKSVFPGLTAPNISMNINQWHTLNKIAKLCIENRKELRS
tara:strand:- start:404 stop:1009 length:606 start_codon:yes stop_codon:yes gene_type:complete